MTTTATITAPHRRRFGLSWVFALSALEVMSLLFGAGPPFQPMLSIIFVATCPGFLLFELDYPADRVARVVLGIAASLSVNMLIVTVALVGDRTWIVPAIVAILAGLAFLPRYQLRAVLGKLSDSKPAAKTSDLRGDGSPQSVPIKLNPTDLNQASAADFASLPSINGSLAHAIVAYRDEHGPFTNFNQLLRVRGIGPTRLAGIQARTTLTNDDETQEEH